MTAPRLPVPGSDDGNWGNILNEYLQVAHTSTGALKEQSVIADAATKASAAQPISEKGQDNGYAPLDNNGRVPTLNLPELLATTDSVAPSAKTLAALVGIDQTPNYETAYIQLATTLPDAFPVHNPPETMHDVIVMQLAATLGRYTKLQDDIANGATPNLDGAQVYEVYAHIDYVPDPSNLDIATYNLVEGHHVLITSTNNTEGGSRGIYVVQDGRLTLSTDIFDGNHNGALIWAYRQTDGVAETGPLLYGVYTTEFCSLVTLSDNSAIPNTYLSKLGDTMSGHLGVNTDNDYGALTVGGNIATDSQGDIFSQRDGNAGATYPVFARYWDNHDTWPASTFIFGSGTNPIVGIEKPGGTNIDLFRVRADSSTFSNDVTVGGAINGVSKLKLPVMRVTLTSHGSVGTITKDIPFYLEDDGATWKATETLTTLPFTGGSGHIAHLGFEPVIMPFGQYYFKVLSGTITVSNTDASQVLSLQIPYEIPVANSFEAQYDPVVWSPSPIAQTGSDLSLSSITHIDTNTPGVFQASVQFTATIYYDDGSGHQGN